MLELVDLLGGLPVQLQVFGHLSDGHDLAHFVDVPSQADGDPHIRLKKLQILDDDSMALGTEDLPVPATEPHTRRGQIQISYRSLSPTVGVDTSRPTPVAYRTEALVRDNIEVSLGTLTILCSPEKYPLLVN